MFYKLVDIVGGKAKWITLIDTKYGNVTLQSTYDKNYEIVNIVSGSRLQAINSEKNDIKFVNSATGNVTVVLNGTVSGEPRAGEYAGGERGSLDPRSGGVVYPERR